MKMHPDEKALLAKFIAEQCLILAGLLILLVIDMTIMPQRWKLF